MFSMLLFLEKSNQKIETGQPGPSLEPSPARPFHPHPPMCSYPYADQQNGISILARWLCEFHREEEPAPDLIRWAECGLSFEIRAFFGYFFSKKK
jgi:hypothetical protein